MESALHDLRVGLRLLWKDKGFTATVALTLAICIGANAALFAVVHNVLLRPLNVPESDRILLMGNAYPGAGVATGTSSGVPDYFDRLRETDVFEVQAMTQERDRTIDQNGTPLRVQAIQVTPSFFPLIRIAPALGRAFTEDEGDPANAKRVILSYELWQAQFGGDPQAVGKDLRIDDQPFTIVGVMPRGFYYLNPELKLWVPLAFTPEQKADNARHNNSWQHVGRLKPGATLERAQQEIDALNTANLDRFPQYKQLLINAGFHTIVQRLQDQLVSDIKPTLYLLWGGAIFVLLIGCVNVANLVLVRSRARLKELATRVALGAGRARVARQLITESVLLTLLSAAAGLFLGYVMLQLLGTLNIQDLPRGREIHLDGVVIAWTLGVSALIGIALGMIPVATVLPANLTTVLREEGRTGTSGRGARTLRRALVVAQVAFAFVLLVGAGLLFASFRQVLAIDPGFSADRVMTAAISLPNTRYEKDTQKHAFLDQALDGIRALPGVTAAGATDTIPFGDNQNDSVILAEGYKMLPGESLISPQQALASAGYFEAMRAKLVRGRFFDARDSADAPKVVIIDQKLASHFWPDADPIGRRMYLASNDPDHLIDVTDKTVFYEVIGVIADMKLHSLTEGKQAVGAYFFPMSQSSRNFATFAVRTGSTADPTSLTASIRGVIGGLDRELAVFDTRSMSSLMEKSLVSRRSPVLLSLSFGIVALLLSALGIYGVLAYLVTQRTKEIGIRMALGSSSGAVFELVLREGLVLIGAGFLLGAAGAVGLRKTLESQLFGVSATDPMVLAMVTVVLAAVAVAACALPARRATRIDPIVALAE